MQPDEFERRLIFAAMQFNDGEEMADEALHRVAQSAAQVAVGAQEVVDSVRGARSGRTESDLPPRKRHSPDW